MDDVIIVHCLDNTVYLARTEEGGDLPIRQYSNGEYHVDGELVLSCKERQYSIFKSILPFLKLLEKRKVVFITPLLRYVVTSCCDHPEHVTNSDEPGFEETMRIKLSECRRNFQDFLFCNGLRGFRVMDPNPAVPNNILDEEAQCWGTDPVHLEPEGYERVVDMIEKEIVKLLAGPGSKKRRAEEMAESSAKRQRAPAPDYRAGWISGATGAATRADVQRGGRGRPYGGPPYRGRPFQGRPFRGRFFRGNRGGGY